MEKLKVIYSKLLSKLRSVTQIDEVLANEKLKEKKLLKGNVILSDKRVYRLICIGITFIILAALNIVFKAFMSIPSIIRGGNGLSVFLPSFKLIPVYFFGLVVSGIASFVLYYKIQVSFKDLNVGQKGNARWMKIEEIAERFPCIEEKIEGFEGWGGAPVARYGDKLYIDNTVGHNIIYSITRGGKTESLAIPTIDIVSRAEKKASILAIDVKGTTTSASVPHLIDRGYDVYILDFFDVSNSIFYNPLGVISNYFMAGDPDEAEELLASLAAQLYPKENGAAEKIWTEGPRSLFSATVLALMEDCKEKGETEKITLFNVFVFFTMIDKLSNEKNKEKKLDSFFNNRDILSPARLAYTSIRFSEERTRSSLLTLMVNSLDLYRRSNIAKLTSKNSLDLTRLGFGDKPVAIFLKVPYYLETYDGLVSAFISQAFYLNMKKAAEPEYAGVMPRRVRMVADEVFNFPAIYRFEKMIPVSLSAGWSCDLYAQSIQQASDVYGEKVAKIIMDNCATTYFLASNDEKTLEKISTMCGKKTVENVTRSGERFSLNKTITEQFEERPLITTDELRALQIGEMIVFPAMAREDLERKKVSALPIYNHDETALLYRYQYLPEFDYKAKIPYEKLDMEVGAVKRVDLRKLLYVPAMAEKPEKPKDEQLQLLVGETLPPATTNYIANLLPDVLEIDLNKVTFETLQDVIKHEYSQGNLNKSVYKALLGLSVPPKKAN